MAEWSCVSEYASLAESLGGESARIREVSLYNSADTSDMSCVVDAVSGCARSELLISNDAPSETIGCESCDQGVVTPNITTIMSKMSPC